MLNQIQEHASLLARHFLSTIQLPPNSTVIIGCSSSEVVGKTIGKASSQDAANIIFHSLYNAFSPLKINLVAQCCEHLNRAVIMERSLMLALNLNEVCVVPKPHAGGAFASACFQNFSDPVAVESVLVDAGIDIGQTLIGMHLKPVAVPVRLPISKIGCANITVATTRPKFIGGDRAVYTP